MKQAATQLSGRAICSTVTISCMGIIAALIASYMMSVYDVMANVTIQLIATRKNADRHAIGRQADRQTGRHAAF